MAEQVEELNELGMDSLEDMEFLSSTQEETTEEEVTDETTDEESGEESDEDNDNSDPDEADDAEEEEIVADEDVQGKGTPFKDIKSTLFSFASALAEKGVLSSLDKDTKIESFDDVADLINKQIRENEFSGLNDRQKSFLERLALGLPEDEYINTEKTLTNLSEITEDKLKEDDSLRKQLIEEEFLSKGYSKEKASKLAQRSIDIGEDLEDAKEALEAKKERIKQEDLAKVEQRKKEIATLQKQQAEMADKIKAVVFDETKELIPGVKFNKQVAQKVYDNMTKPAGYTEDGKPINAIIKARMEDPIGFDHKLHNVFVLTDGFKDFSKLGKSFKTKNVKEFEEKLNMNTLSTEGSMGGSGDKFDKLLDQLEKSL